MTRDAQKYRAAALWREAIEANEAFLLAGIRRRVGNSGDVLAERRRLYEKWTEEHDETIRRLVARMNRALEKNG